MHFRFYFVQNIWQNLPSQMQISYVDNNEIVKPCISYFPKSYFNISELNYTNTNLHLFQSVFTTQTSSNTTAWTLDKYGTNAHDAFFYVEVSCSPPNIWSFLLSDRATLKVFINCFDEIATIQVAKSRSVQHSCIIIQLHPTSYQLKANYQKNINITTDEYISKYW